MRFDEYRRQDATALASLIAKKEVSAKEVLEAAIARAEEVNPAINAIVHKQYDRARSAVAAGAAQRAAQRRTFSHQDLGFFEKGEPATFGSSLFGISSPITTAPTSRAAREAGLVFMGRSSSPEFGLSPNTEPRLYGSCRNPWNLEHSAGGSSGGAAAAVIAGVLPMAHATDGGGSIRIPAAQCGLFGLKPSRGRMSHGAGCRRGLGRAFHRPRGEPQRARLGPHARLHRRPEPGDPMPHRRPSAPSSKPSAGRRRSSRSR